jgi:hypothetical protein
VFFSTMKVPQSQLCWRGTFLDVRDEGSDSEKSPRASSDPGSECSSFHFHDEKKSVELFSERMQNVWLGSKFAKGSCSSSSTDGGFGETSSDHSPFHDEPKSHQNTLRFPQPDYFEGTRLSPIATTTKSDMRNIAQSAQLSNALSVVDGLPEQVSEILQQRVLTLADDVHGEVADVRKIIRDTETSEAGAEEAIERLEAIPELIRRSFKASLAKMKMSVQQRVDGVIKRIDRSDFAHDQIASQLWSIPEEILQIAEEAVGEAVQESQAQATQQLEFALEFAPDTVAAKQVALQQAKDQIISHMPRLPEEARTAAADTIEHAVAVVRHELAGATASTNQNVADALLRAKQGEKVHSLGADEGFPSIVPLNLSAALAEKQATLPISPPNPGSIGHPEYCPRACLFYPLGKCTNGNQCGFCHLPHLKRPAHLDKRHREMLKLMTFNECSSIVVPIMMKKVVTMNMGPEMMTLLEALRVSQVVESDAAKKIRVLEKSLRVLPFRTLATMLHTKVPDFTRERVVVDGIMQHMRAVA